MGEVGGHKIEVTFDDETMTMLVACAAWRNVPVAELVRAYVEDWIDIDYLESKGRFTRHPAIGATNSWARALLRPVKNDSGVRSRHAMRLRQQDC